MTMPLTNSCFIKIQINWFRYRLTQIIPDKVQKAVPCMCVCVKQQRKISMKISKSGSWTFKKFHEILKNFSIENSISDLKMWHKWMSTGDTLESVGIIRSMFLETIASFLPLALRAPHGSVFDAVHLAAFLHIRAWPAMPRRRRFHHEVVACRLQLLRVKRMWKLQHTNTPV